MRAHAPPSAPLQLRPLTKVLLQSEWLRVAPSPPFCASCHLHLGQHMRAHFPAVMQLMPQSRVWHSCALALLSAAYVSHPDASRKRWLPKRRSC
jgi:hypothetical protein